MTETSERPAVGLDPRFVVDLKGRMFPTYAGVLDMASRSGLKELTTKLVQIPDAGNGNVAIVTAMAVFDDGRIFEDVGDASPANVNKMIAVHIIRMASTRAKGRALRDAMNIGTALAEEIHDEEPNPGPQNGRPREYTATRRDAPPAPRGRHDEASSQPFRPGDDKTIAQRREEFEKRRAEATAPKVSRAQAAEKYRSWLEKAAGLGALHTHPEAFNLLREFDPMTGSEADLVTRARELKGLVEKLEKDAAPAEDGDLFADQ